MLGAPGEEKLVSALLQPHFRRIVSELAEASQEICVDSRIGDMLVTADLTTRSSLDGAVSDLIKSNNSRAFERAVGHLHPPDSDKVQQLCMAVSFLHDIRGERTIRLINDSFVDFRPGTLIIGGLSTMFDNVLSVSVCRTPRGADAFALSEDNRLAEAIEKSSCPVGDPSLPLRVLFSEHIAAHLAQTAPPAKHGTVGFDAAELETLFRSTGYMPPGATTCKDRIGLVMVGRDEDEIEAPQLDSEESDAQDDVHATDKLAV